MSKALHREIDRQKSKKAVEAKKLQKAREKTAKIYAEEERSKLQAVIDATENPQFTPELEQAMAEAREQYRKDNPIPDERIPEYLRDFFANEEALNKI